MANVMRMPDVDLRDRVIVITGAARGMGRAYFDAFGKASACVVGIDRAWEGADADGAQKLGRTLCLEADVTRGETLDRALDRTLQEFGRVDALVNNAALLPRAVYPPTGRMTVLGTREEDWELFFAVNTFGALKVIRRFIQPMMQQRSGSIVNITSRASAERFRVDSQEQPYMASKAALTNLSYYLAHEVRAYNVAVNVVFPGSAWTTGADEAVAAKRQMGIEADPLRPDHVVPLVSFLVSIDGSYGITGQNFSAIEWNHEHGLGRREDWFAHPSGLLDQEVTSGVRNNVLAGRGQ